MNRTIALILSIVLALDLAVLSSMTKLYPYLQVHVLDVGQGDAILIVTPEQNHILVDGSAQNTVLTELPEVVPYLFPKIDLLVLTHPHADHIEGLIYVLDRFEVGAVLMSAPEYDSLLYDAFLERLDGRQIYIADDGTDFRFGHTTLDVLYPFEPVREIENVNNASPVILVEWEGNRVLLSGDAEVEVEELVFVEDVDLMKAGHHGSKTASSREFLEAADPEFLMISCGEGNSFGHPHEETLQKAASLGIEVLRTDQDGRISFIFAPYSWVRSIFAPRLRSFSSSRS